MNSSLYNSKVFWVMQIKSCHTCSKEKSVCFFNPRNPPDPRMVLVLWRVIAVLWYVLCFFPPAVELNSQIFVLKWTLCVSWLCYWDVEEENRHLSSACLSVGLPFCISIVRRSPCSFALGEVPKLEMRRWREMKGRHIMTDLMTSIWIGFLCCGLPSIKKNLSFFKQKYLLNLVKVRNFDKISLYLDA